MLVISVQHIAPISVIERCGVGCGAVHELLCPNEPGPAARLWLGLLRLMGLHGQARPGLLGLLGLFLLMGLLGLWGLLDLGRGPRLGLADDLESVCIAVFIAVSSPPPP